MKTNEALEILERKNFVRVTEKLASASAEFADNLLKAIFALKATSLRVPEVGTLVAIQGETNVGSYYGLRWDGSDGDLTFHRIGDGTDSEYVHGDFNHVAYWPTKEDVLLLALSKDKILEALRTAQDKFEYELENAISHLEG